MRFFYACHAIVVRAFHNGSSHFALVLCVNTTKMSYIAVEIFALSLILQPAPFPFKTPAQRSNHV